MGAYRLQGGGGVASTRWVTYGKGRQHLFNIIYRQDAHKATVVLLAPLQGLNGHALLLGHRHPEGTWGGGG